MRKRFFIGLLTAILCASCSESTGLLGVVDDDDLLTSTTETFGATTKSVAMGRVIADNSSAYLGCVTDPETGGTITATCAAQFYCLEDYQLPSKELMIENENADGNIIQKWCDSCEVRLYLKNVYGEKNNPMKLEVYLLDDDKDRMFNEDSIYYTDTDLMQFVSQKHSQPIAERVFTPRDYMLSQAELESSSHTDNIVIPLPTSFGQQILDEYYKDSTNFSNSYKFIHNVFPGFLFKISNGEGTMLTTQVGVINLFYDYRLADEEKKDSVLNGVTRFAATPEVIQSSSFTNSSLQELIDSTDCTFLKTPAGIATEMTLPIDDIYEEHMNDSISLASITLLRYNKKQSEFQLGCPSRILMVRKKDAEDFFKNRKVPDAKTSFLATFNSVSNTYYFNNIARLISLCHEEKKNQTADEEYNKVLLIPVTTTSNTSGNVTSVTNEMALTSIKLQGGANEKIPLQVVYTRHK